MLQILLRADILQPLLSKRIQILPQFRNPSARFRVDLLINRKTSVLSECQRFQRSFLRIYAEGHFRIIQDIAILRVGVAYGDYIRADPLNMQRHHGCSRFQLQITVFAAGDFRKQLCKRAIIALRQGLP